MDSRISSSFFAPPSIDKVDFENAGYYEFFVLNLISFNKITCFLFKDAPYLPRALKVLNICTQFIILLCITGVLTIYWDVRLPGKLLMSVFIIRVIKRILIVMLNRGNRYMFALIMNIITAVVLLVIFILLHFIIFRLTTRCIESVLEQWRVIYLSAAILENFILDLFIAPAYHLALCKGYPKYLKKVVYP